jgi:23S rRNA pseudouridine1911/1915/1917 synthase
MEPAILFEDNHCLVVAKPAPLPTQSVPGGPPSLENWAKEYLKAKYGKPGNVYLGVPHRLDRPVSGIVVFARNSKAAARLAEQFQKRQVEKVYWAIVEGSLDRTEDDWRDWVRKLKDQARVEVVPVGSAGSKPAETHCRILGPVDGGTLLELRPKTGRTHQLRIQSASRGHAILGDELYGSTTPFGPAKESPRDRVIALHAGRLTFLHPIRYEPVTVIMPPPDYWGDVALLAEFRQPC